MVIILVGVAGSGKTTVGRILAARLGCEFHDADDLHPPQNREKMSRGIALSDEDRWPWLHAVRDLVQQRLLQNRCEVIACSALKQSYRDLLVVDPAKVKVVYLKGSQVLIAQRFAREPATSSTSGCCRVNSTRWKSRRTRSSWISRTLRRKLPTRSAAG